MTVRPAPGTLVAFCTCLLFGHDCTLHDMQCWWDFGTVGMYMPGYTKEAVPVKTVRGQWTLSTVSRVHAAVWTFAGPIRRTWRTKEREAVHERVDLAKSDGV